MEERSALFQTAEIAEDAEEPRQPLASANSAISRLK
jgi:hypothetical protein